MGTGGQYSAGRFQTARLLDPFQLDRIGRATAAAVGHYRLNDRRPRRPPPPANAPSSAGPPLLQRSRKANDRPETNSALAAWAHRIGLKYNGAVFQANGATYASERNSLVMAATNPLDTAHMVLIFAGNDPLHTVEALNTESAPTPVVVLENGKELSDGTK